MRTIGCIVAWLAAQLAFGQSAYLTKAQALKNQIDASYLQNQQQVERTVQQYEQLRQLYLENRDYRRAAEIWLDLAAMQYDRGEYPLAVSYYRSGWGELKKSKVMAPDTSAFKFESALAENYRQLARYDSSQYFFELAENRLVSQPQLSSVLPVYVFAFLNNAGLLHKTFGDYPRCLIYFEKALEIARSLRSVDYLSYILGNTAALYQAQGAYRRAQTLYREALEHTRYDFERVMQWQQLGECYLDQGQVDSARGAFEQASKLFKRLKVRDVEAVGVDFEMGLKNHLGRLNIATQDRRLARRYFDEALQLSKAFVPDGKHPYVAQAHVGLAQVSEQGGLAPQQCLVHYQRAICALHDSFTNLNPKTNPPLQGVSDEKLFFEILRHKAKLLQLVDRQASLKTYWLAIDLAERMRRRYESADAKLFFSEQVAGIYAEVLELLYDLYRRNPQQLRYLEMGFRVAELNKAAVLADALQGSQIKPQAVPRGIIRREMTLKRAITQEQIALLRPQTPSQRAALRRRLNDKLLEMSRLEWQVEKRFPAYYQLKYRVLNVDISQVRAQLLDEHSALVTYTLGGEFVHIQVITARTTIWKRVPLKTDFEQTVQQLNAQLRQAPGLKPYAGTPPAVRLYAQLVKPIEGLLSGVERLIVLRDGALHYFPFEVLQSSPTSRYLTQQYAISYGASATLLCQSTDASRLSSTELLGMAPFAGTLGQGLIRDSLLRSLPASASEVTQIGGDVYVADQATKRQFLEKYRSHGVIHLATHAQVNDAEPMASFIAFYPDSTEYRLYSSELYDLSLEHTVLVVLSACETGRGKFHRGEGMLSLGRAFQYAGCPSVISTLWNAHDQSSAYLAARLHEYLQAGKPIDIALQQARIDYFASSIGRELDHPYYWANFVLMGRREAIVHTPIWPLALLLMVACVGALAGWYWLRKARQAKALLNQSA